MKNVLNAVTVLSLLVPTLSQAKMASSKIERLINAASMKPHPKPFRVDKCSNFKGVWEGQCVQLPNPADPGRIEESFITIDQDDCSRLSIDNIPIPAQGSFSAHISYPPRSSKEPTSVVMSGSWNDAQTRFTVVYNVALPTWGQNFLQSTNYEMDGETLVVSDGVYEVGLDASGNPTTWHPVREDCRYTKKH